MESVAYLDTHVVAWLYAGNTAFFPATAATILSRCSLYVSPMVTLELQYLKEIGRISEGPEAILAALHCGLGLTVCNRSFAEVAQRAWLQDWTRDPFDRIITAQAAVGGDVLLSKDASIAANYPNTVWS